MKRLLTVTAILFCAWLSQGFTVSRNTQHNATRLMDATIWYNHQTDKPSGTILQRLRINYSDVCNIATNGEISGQHTFTTGPGSIVTVELQVDQSLISSFYVQVIDWNTGFQTYYQDSGWWAGFTFTAEDGHSYTVNSYVY